VPSLNDLFSNCLIESDSRLSKENSQMIKSNVKQQAEDEEDKLITQMMDDMKK
jgi:hypothetical protein